MEITVIGTPDPQYHPLSNIAELGGSICGHGLVYTQDHDRLLALRKQSGPLLICYMDLWERPLTAAQADALKEYMQSGGNILSIHNGISLQDTPGLTELTGARFTQHPPMEDLLIKPVAGHPVTDGVQEFSVFDEPYHYEITGDIKTLAHYDWEGKSIPAAWEHAYGKGLLIYLMPGHDKSAFQSGQYRQLIRNSVNYLIS